MRWGLLPLFVTFCADWLLCAKAVDFCYRSATLSAFCGRRAGCDKALRGVHVRSSSWRFATFLLKSASAPRACAGKLHREVVQRNLHQELALRESTRLVQKIGSLFAHRVTLHRCHLVVLGCGFSISVGSAGSAWPAWFGSGCPRHFSWAVSYGCRGWIELLDGDIHVRARVSRFAP